MEELEIRQALRTMELDQALNTESSYSANTALWPDHRITFTEKHMAYLRAHPTLNPRHYLSNLKLMIKKLP